MLLRVIRGKITLRVNRRSTARSRRRDGLTIDVVGKLEAEVRIGLQGGVGLGDGGTVGVVEYVNNANPVNHP